MSDPKPRLLVIDDEQGQLSRLSDAVRVRLPTDAGTIDVWRPSAGDNLRETLVAKLEPRPVLVVTDHDLTANGAAGLFGGGVVSWCRAHAIPVGDYSNKIEEADLEKPDVFEFRFPDDPAAAAGMIAGLFKGFTRLAAALATRPVGTDGSWSHTLAATLGRPQVAGAFSLYSLRAGIGHVASIERLRSRYGDEDARRLLECYVLGHMLRNGILEQPGPLLDASALCSYLAISNEHASRMTEIFASAKYDGPFGDDGAWFWHELVDERLLDLADAGKLDGDIGDDRIRREIMALRLVPGLHECRHCDGDRGGFRCPYTGRTTCERADCSVPTSSWVPQGAYLTRTDRDYFDRMSPLLGM